LVPNDSDGLEADFPPAKLAFKDWPAAEFNVSKVVAAKLASKSASQSAILLTGLSR
jgi:hypothetical protein